jgi:hypothetical protein
MRRFAVLGLSSGLVTAAVVFYLFRYRGSGRQRAAPKAGPLEIVEESSIESFPASDSPPWTQGSLM